MTHLPVLPRETLEALAPRANATIVDGTVGLGGHAALLLDAVGPAGCVVGIDRDPAALERARVRLAHFGSAFVALHGDHREIGHLLESVGVFAVDGALFDLGVSSLQLDDPERGFSFRHDGPLDMRMDPSRGRTAAELVASADEVELATILRDLGEERRSRSIARAIVQTRAKTPITRTRQLAELIERVQGPAAQRLRIHPATRSFQALRIAVNEELVGLDRLITDSVALLRRGCRIAVISFHSLEDRLVKRALRALAERCICPPRLPVCGCGRENLVRLLTTRPIRPGAAEIEANPRSRSARLRVAERL